MKCWRHHHRRWSDDVHVYRDTESCRWVVANGGRTHSRHHRQATAIREAIRAARRQGVDLVTHGLNGRIRHTDHDGYESPRRDTEY